MFVFCIQHCVREAATAAAAAALMAEQAALGAPASLNATPILTTTANVNPNDASNLTRPKEAKPNASILTTPTNRTGAINLANKHKGDKMAASTTLAIPKPNDSDGKTPQSIAIVAGRKYIMVPKSPNKNVNGVEATKSS